MPSRLANHQCTSDFRAFGGVKYYHQNFFFALSYNQSLRYGPIITYVDYEGRQRRTIALNQNLQVGVGYFLNSKKNNFQN